MVKWLRKGGHVDAFFSKEEEDGSRSAAVYGQLPRCTASCSDCACGAMRRSTATRRDGAEKTRRATLNSASCWSGSGRSWGKVGIEA